MQARQLGKSKLQRCPRGIYLPRLVAERDDRKKSREDNVPARNQLTPSQRTAMPCRVIEQVWQRLWLRARIVAYRKRSITSSEGFNSSGMETSGSQRKRMNLFVTGAFMAPIHTPQETLFLFSGAFRQ